MNQTIIDLEETYAVLRTARLACAGGNLVAYSKVLHACQHIERQLAAMIAE